MLEVTGEAAAQAAFVMFLVAAIRHHAPKIDGWRALLAAAVVTVVVVVASAPVTEPRAAVLRILAVFGAAVGANAWASHTATKMAPKTIVSIPPPPMPKEERHGLE